MLHFAFRYRVTIIAFILISSIQFQPSMASEKWNFVSKDQWSGAIICKEDQVNHRCFAFRCGTGRGAEFSYLFSGGDIEVGRKIAVQIDSTYKGNLEVTSGNPNSELNFALDPKTYQGLVSALRKGNVITLTFDQEVEFSLSGSSRHLGRALKKCADNLPSQVPKVLAGAVNSSQTHSNQNSSKPKIDDEPVTLTTAAIQTVFHELKLLGQNLSGTKSNGLINEELQRAIAQWQQFNGWPATGNMTRSQLSRMFKTKNVDPLHLGKSEPSKNASPVPFLVLKGVTLGGEGEYLRHFEEPRLKGISLDRCMAHCAADDRCNAVSFIHGCTLMNNISYRHDNTGNYSSGAVVSFRPRSPTNSQPSESVPINEVIGNAVLGYEKLNPVNGDFSAQLAQRKFEYPVFEKRNVSFPQITVRSKFRPNSLNAENLVYGELGKIKGRSLPFFLRDWVSISDAHNRAINAYENILQAGRYGQPDDKSRAIVPMFQAALKDAETTYGTNHPVLGFLIMDLAEVSSEYTTALVPWEQAQGLKRELMRKAAELLANITTPNLKDIALISSHAAIALIDTIRIDGLSTSDPDGLAEAAGREFAQWGRCSVNDAEDRRRSDNLLSVLAQHRDATELQTLHLGWLKRATNCLDDNDRIVQLLSHRVGYAHSLGNHYAISVALADLGHALFNAGDEKTARQAFAESIGLFKAKVSGKSHLDFINTVYTNEITEDLEYYPRGDNRKRKVWQSFVALEMKPEAKYVLAKEFDALIKEGHLGGFAKDYHIAFFAQFLEAAEVPSMAKAIYSHINFIRKGVRSPSAVAGVLGIVEAGIETENPSFFTNLLHTAKTFAEESGIPEDQARVSALLAGELDERGDLESAAESAREALVLIKEHSLDTQRYDLENLNLMITKARREQGEIILLADELAAGVQKALAPVCAGQLDLTAFPWLPLDDLVDDPLLTEAFLKKSVLTDYLDCFRSQRSKLGYKDWSGGHLSADLLTDVLFALARTGRKEEAESYFQQLVTENHWDDNRGFGARQIAISAAVDGLILAQRSEWVEPFADELLQLKSSDAAIGGRAQRALIRMAYAAHSIGRNALVDEIAVVLHRAAKEFASGRYSGGSSCGNSCEFLYFYESLMGNVQAAEIFKKDFFRLGGFHFKNKSQSVSFSDRKARRDGHLTTLLHEKAGRYELAEIYSAALNLNDGMVKAELLKNERPLDRVGNIRFATSAARLASKRGDRIGAQKIAQHFLSAARKRTRDATIVGTDPLVRWSTRLGGLFETYLSSVEFPMAFGKTRNGLGSNVFEDAFFAAQFLQTTNTASTFAKLSARIGKNGSGDLRALQDVSASLDKAFSSMISQNNAEAAETAKRVKKLQKTQQKLRVKLSKESPKALEFATLQFPSLNEIQKVLEPSEAVLSTIVGADAVYIWLIRNDRSFAHKLSETPEKLSSLIEKIRKISNPTTIGNPINTTLLHDVYLSLFGKIESELLGVDNLIFVPHKLFDGLPLSVLLTEPPISDQIEFSELRELRLPWLIRKFAVSVMPSMAAIRFLKERGSNSVDAPNPFFGIGNPVFDQPLRLQDQESPNSVRRRGGFKVTNLPETELELKRLAKLLGADEKGDLLLGRSANEAALKAKDLSNYNIVAFATHGMIANELLGIQEPSLLLTVPNETVSKEDGILFSSEIADLKLNADLVVLSACNTAAGSGRPGAEGLSGLANAFFFAGARQLVVTHRHIPSESAVEISVGMVQKKKNMPHLGWPGALRLSLLELIDEKGANYNAHPLMWGAHMLVGVSH